MTVDSIPSHPHLETHYALDQVFKKLIKAGEQQKAQGRVETQSFIHDPLQYQLQIMLGVYIGIYQVLFSKTSM